MQSNNPVFRRSEEFKAGNAYGNPTYAGNGAAYQGFGDAPAPAQGQGQGYDHYQAMQGTARRLDRGRAGDAGAGAARRTRP